MRPFEHISRRRFLEQSIEAAVALGLAEGCHRVPASTLPQASTAQFHSAGDRLTLANDALAATWRVDGSALRGVDVVDARSGERLRLPESAIVLTLADGTVLDASTLRLIGMPSHEDIAPKAHASRRADAIRGTRITATLEDPARRLRATWRATLRDGTRYVRQEVVLQALSEPVPIRRITMIDIASPAARESGSVRGSPIVVDNWYLGFEHPLSVTTVDGGHDKLLDDLATHAIDIAIMTTRAAAQDDRALPLWSEQVILALPQQHPLSDHVAVHWQDLVNEPVLIPEEGPGPELEHLLATKLHCVGARQTLHQDVSLDRLLSLVAAGYSVLLMLEGATGIHYDGLVYREMHDDAGPTRLNFSAYWRQANGNPTLPPFLNLLRERYPDLSA